MAAKVNWKRPEWMWYCDNGGGYSETGGFPFDSLLRAWFLLVVDWLWTVFLFSTILKHDQPFLRLVLSLIDRCKPWLPTHVSHVTPKWTACQSWFQFFSILCNIYYSWVSLSLLVFVWYDKPTVSIFVSLTILELSICSKWCTRMNQCQTSLVPGQLTAQSPHFYRQTSWVNGGFSWIFQLTDLVYLDFRGFSWIFQLSLPACNASFTPPQRRLPGGARCTAWGHHAATSGPGLAAWRGGRQRKQWWQLVSMSKPLVWIIHNYSSFFPYRWHSMGTTRNRLWW